jgi:hypothetical protein
MRSIDELLARFAVNAKVATVQGSIPTSSFYTVESEGRENRIPATIARMAEAAAYQAAALPADYTTISFCV